MNKSLFTLTLISFFGFILIGFTANSTKDGSKNYKQYCATCHGANLQGGMSQSLADGKWMFGNKDADLIKNIKNGIPKNGMPAFEAVLSEVEIKDLVAFLREEENKYKNPEYKLVTVLETFDYKVNVELVTDKLEEPWAIDFINPNKALITEKPGRLRILENGKLLTKPINGIPKVLNEGQGGLLDVAVDPEYNSNGWIYISFSHEIDGKAMTKLVRGKLKGNNWIDEEVLFAAPESFYIETRHHFGSRIVFDDKGYLYFSIGDRGKRENAQDLTRPNGKIHRINKDGSIPEDNPFFTSNEKYFKTI
ncbi:MAG: PQQ-dependent sugar dehydrogenase, partial [Ignavibacteriae bacterium]|nr:PQQ-dependent sugar dehydrogenase [Ignavibacteriota bacterium]